MFRKWNFQSAGAQQTKPLIGKGDNDSGINKTLYNIYFILMIFGSVLVVFIWIGQSLIASIRRCLFGRSTPKGENIPIPFWDNKETEYYRPHAYGFNPGQLKVQEQHSSEVFLNANTVQVTCKICFTINTFPVEVASNVCVGCGGIITKSGNALDPFQLINAMADQHLVYDAPVVPILMPQTIPVDDSVHKIDTSGPLMIPQVVDLPPQQPAGLPPKQPAGFPPQQPGGYPPQQPAGFPPQQPAGFPPQQPAGFPPQQPAGFPPQQPAGFPPQQQAGYPNQQGYPPHQGYPNQGYPPQQGYGYGYNNQYGYGR